MANKKRKNNQNSYKPGEGYQSSHSKGTRIFVLVMAAFMVLGLVVTMIAYIINAIVGDDHDHDHGSSSSSSVVTSSSNKGTSDSKPTSSSTPNSTTDKSSDVASSTVNTTDSSVKE